MKEVTRLRDLDSYHLSWLITLHPTLVVVADSTSSSLNLLSFNVRTLEKPILILEMIVKSEAPLELSTLKVLACYNGLEIA